jgi:hypothetical protein
MRRFLRTFLSVSVIANPKGVKQSISTIFSNQHTSNSCDGSPQSLRSFAMTVLVVLCFSSPAVAGDATSSRDVAVKKIGGLICFSVEPRKADPKLKYEDYPTCDELCAEKGAACTGMENSSLNPPVTCADHTSSTFSVCRCCKVGQ